MSGLSDKAIKAAQHATFSPCSTREARKRIAEAAYPQIRADVLAEVVAALRAYPNVEDIRGHQSAADFIEREFGAF